MIELFFSLNYLWVSLQTKPPKRNRFHYYMVTHIFHPKNLALNFPLTVPKSQIQGQRFTPRRLVKWVSDRLKAPQQKHPQWLWPWENKWSRCIVCIPSQQIILKTRLIGGGDCMVMDSNIQDQQEHKRARQPPNVSFVPCQRWWHLLSRLVCPLWPDSQFSGETGNLDVYVNSPDCKILSMKFRKTISLNHFQGQTKCKNTSAGWAWHTGHQDVAFALCSGLA